MSVVFLGRNYVGLYTLHKTPVALTVVSDKAIPAYTWSQTTEDCNLQFVLPPQTTKADVIYHITPTHMELSVKNGKTLLDGHLHAKVDVEGCTWTLQADHM